jgi:hypothetical protein
LAAAAVTAFDEFAPPDKDFEERLEDVLLKYLGPCSVCGKFPNVGDLWRIERVGSEERVGHPACLKQS